MPRDTKKRCAAVIFLLVEIALFGFIKIDTNIERKENAAAVTSVSASADMSDEKKQNIALFGESFADDKRMLVRNIIAFSAGTVCTFVILKRFFLSKE